MAMATHSISKPGVYSSGTGILENAEWRKSVVRFHHLDELARTVKRIEKLIKKDDEK
jgi:UDP-3-O-[3-hydroxymyristoyl] glucosamine N-acyltransferase